jgi:hypothetical protein
MPPPLSPQRYILFLPPSTQQIPLSSPQLLLPVSLLLSLKLAENVDVILTEIKYKSNVCLVYSVDYDATI